MESLEGGTEIDLVGGGTGPVSRLRWSSVLAGAVAFLSVGLLLWSLAMAIVSLAAHPTVASTRASALALWGSAMVATIIGAIVGGWFAGRSLVGSSPGLGAAHGFVVWGVSLLAAFAFQVGAHRGLATAAVFGLSEAGTWDSPSQMPTRPAPPSPRFDSEGASWRIARDYLAGASCSWFTTWVIAGIVATAAGAAGAAGSGVSRISRPDFSRRLESEEDPSHREPLRPTTAT